MQQKRQRIAPLYTTIINPNIETHYLVRCYFEAVVAWLVHWFLHQQRWFPCSCAFKCTSAWCKRCCVDVSHNPMQNPPHNPTCWLCDCHLMVLQLVLPRGLNLTLANCANAPAFLWTTRSPLCCVQCVNYANMRTRANRSRVFRPPRCACMT